MYLPSGEGIAHTHRVNHVLDVVDAGGIKRAVAPQQAGEQMVAGIHLVAHAHQPFTAAREPLVQRIKPFAVGFQIHHIVDVASLERNLRMAGEELKLDDIAEHDIGILQHGTEGLYGFRTRVFPKVLAMVDVERDGEPHLIGHTQRLESGFRGIGRQCTGNAGSVEHTRTAQHLPPVYHPWLYQPEGRGATVIGDRRVAQCCSTLEIIGAHAFAVAQHMADIKAILPEHHLGGQANLPLGKTRDILHLVAQRGQRDGHIGLTTTKIAQQQLTLCETLVTLLRKTKQQLTESDYTLTLHLHMF